MGELRGVIDAHRVNIAVAESLGVLEERETIVYSNGGMPAQAVLQIAVRVVARQTIQRARLAAHYVALSADIECGKSYLPRWSGR